MSSVLVEPHHLLSQTWRMICSRVTTLPASATSRASRSNSLEVSSISSSPSQARRASVSIRTPWTTRVSEAPRRSSYSLGLSNASARLWPHVLFGAALIVFLALAAPGALLWFAPFLFGLLVAIPFASLTSSPTVTDMTRRLNLCAVPEDLDMPFEVAMTRSAQVQT